jgi:hypothetical protein
VIPFKQYLLQEGSVREYLEKIAPLQHMKKNGFAYDGPAEFILKHGKQYQSAELTPEEMDMLKDVLKLQCKYKVRQCSYNAQDIGLTGRIGYVEGMADSIGHSTDHAWNTINGKVIDMTWRMNNGGKPILGVIPEGWEYYGVELSSKLITKMWGTGRQHFLINDWENGFPLLKEPFE